jgi:hypothetical protein
MPGATVEQCAIVRAWLMTEFNPTREVPATHLLPKMLAGDHQHGSTLGSMT